MAVATMDINGWNQRYRSREHAQEDLLAPATALVVRTAQQLRPGKALDLACGSGRNALWLAEQGWDTTAVDGATAAIESLEQRAKQAGLTVRNQVADLKSATYDILPGHWDLIIVCYYLQRDLLAPAMAGLRAGGVLLVIVHIAEAGEQPTEHRLAAGELKAFFPGGKILHYREGKPDDPAHKRAVAEIVVQR